MLDSVRAVVSMRETLSVTAAITAVTVARKSPIICSMPAARSRCAACSACWRCRHAAPLDLAGAEHFERARHLADLVAVGGGRHREVGLARGQAAHRVADRGQPPHQAALHVEHADAARDEHADRRDDHQQHAVAREVLHQLGRAALHRLLGLADQHRDRAVERALDRDVLVDGLVGARRRGELARRASRTRSPRPGRRRASHRSPASAPCRGPSWTP